MQAFYIINQLWHVSREKVRSTENDQSDANLYVLGVFVCSFDLKRRCADLPLYDGNEP